LWGDYSIGIFPRAILGLCCLLGIVGFRLGFRLSIFLVLGGGLDWKNWRGFDLGIKELKLEEFLFKGVLRRNKAIRPPAHVRCFVDSERPDGIGF
jgi:hypothetical protein